MQDVITIGAGTRDVFLVSDKFQFIRSPRFEGGIGECVSLGSKIEIDTIVHSTGGGATNAAVTFAHLGFKSATVCRVGNDVVGSGLIVDLQRDGVNTTLVVRAKGNTGYSTLLTDKKTGERSVLVHRGVSASLTLKDIAWKDCTAAWFYVTSTGGNLDVLTRLTAHAGRCRSKIAWNPGSREIARGLPALRPAIRKTDVLILNREEAGRLTKKTHLDGMFAGLRSKGVTIITDGPAGAYAQADEKQFFVHATGTKAISRTGAGDAFGSGFVASYMRDGKIANALRVGTLNAEGVIRKIGAKAGLLSRWPTATDCRRVTVRASKAASL